MKKKIIVVAGPTASGKTGLGIELAEKFNGEIISADSMQVYKGMPISTAVPTAQERARAVHHLVEFLDREESFSVASWCALARDKADEIIAKHKVPIIVGGTGLFIDSFVDHIIFEDIEIDYELRNQLMQRDNESLYNELMTLDAQVCKDIHINNKKRLVRALEVCYAGTSKTRQNLNSRKEDNPYETLYFVLDYNNRRTLYDRINARVDKMTESGLIDEAREILTTGSSTSAQAIGAKELAPYINGEMELKQALDNLKKETRHYAKRQMTWFRRRNDTIRVVMDDDSVPPLDFAIKKCEDFLYG